MLVLQSNIMYLQVVGSMMVEKLNTPKIRKGEELKVPYHASVAAACNGKSPYIKAICLI